MKSLAWKGVVRMRQALRTDRIGSSTEDGPDESWTLSLPGPTPDITGGSMSILRTFRPLYRGARQTRLDIPVQPQRLLSGEHLFTDDGTGISCKHCNLPRGNARHRLVA